jgi:hypothetical protein
MKQFLTAFTLAALLSVLALSLYMQCHPHPNAKHVRVNAALQNLGDLLYSQWPGGIPAGQSFADVLQSARPSLELGQVRLGAANPLPDFLPDATYIYEASARPSSSAKDRPVCWTLHETRSRTFYLVLLADWTCKRMNADELKSPPLTH